MFSLLWRCFSLKQGRQTGGSGDSNVDDEAEDEEEQRELDKERRCLAPTNLHLSKAVGF